MKIFLMSIGLVFILGACGLTAQGEQLRNTIKTTGATIADSNLKTAEWQVCELATYGSIKRKYGVSKDRVDALNNFCPDSSNSPVLQVP